MLVQSIFCYTYQLNIWYMIMMQSVIEIIKYEVITERQDTVSDLDWKDSSEAPSSSNIHSEIEESQAHTSSDVHPEIEEHQNFKIFSGHTRGNAKRMLLLVEVKSDISIYDVYALDIRLPVHLLAIVATYIMETRINNTQEYLSKDILEEESIKSFAPIRILQIFYGTCRVDVRHRFVTAPTVWQKCYSIFCIISVILSHLNLMYMYGHYTSRNIRCTVTIWIIVILVTNTSNLIHNRFFNGEANAKFYVKLQKIDRIMKIDKNEIINNFMYTVSVLIVLYTVNSLILSIVIALAPTSFDFIGVIGIICSNFSFLTELMHCCLNIYHFSVRLRFINCIIVNYLEGNPVRTKPSRRFHIKIPLSYIASLSHHFETSPIDVYLKELCSIFATFRELYQFQVLLCYSRFIPLTLIGVYFILTTVKNDIDVPFAHFISIGFLSYLDVQTLVILSAVCDIFLKETIRTKRLCTSVMALNYEGSLWKKAKKIRNMIEKSPPRFSVYDMWIINALSILNLIYATTSFIITLLQFIFV
ncbi:uncharacterized protein [Epargyreus clarus]|uniref:uncharacterized protein n=1 Tax=Epargyreus clarus TaxID=520877 RepID=UPI003C2EF746